MKQSIWKPNYIYLRSLLKTLRLDKGYTQRHLASLMDKTHSYVAKYELGERNLDYFEVLEICLPLGVKPDVFTKQILEQVDLSRNKN